MYKRNQPTKTTIQRNESVEGERLETKIERFIYDKDTLAEGDHAPLIYTEKNAGVQAGYNIRTDRWEVAAEAMDVVHRGKVAKRSDKTEVPDSLKKKTGTDAESGDASSSESK